MNFEPNEPLDAISRRESLGDLFAMLPDATRQIRCNADVERTVKAARKKVDAGRALHCHSGKEGGPRVKPGVTKEAPAQAWAPAFAGVQVHGFFCQSYCGNRLPSALTPISSARRFALVSGLFAPVPQPSTVLRYPRGRCSPSAQAGLLLRPSPSSSPLSDASGSPHEH